MTVDIGPNISHARHDLFESDAAMEKHRVRERRRNYVRGDALQLAGKILSASMRRQGTGHLLAVGDATGACSLVSIEMPMGGEAEGSNKLRKRLQHRVTAHRGPVSAVCFLGPEGRFLVTGGWDKSLRVYDVAADGTSLKLLLVQPDAHADYVTVLLSLDDGISFASASVDRSVRVWRLDLDNDGTIISSTSSSSSSSSSSSGRLTCLKKHVLHRRAIEACLLTRASLFPTLRTAETQLLLTASSDGLIHVTGLESGVVLATLQGHHTSVYGLHLGHGDPRDSEPSLLFSCSADKRVLLWDCEAPGTLTHVWQLQHWIRCVAHSSKHDVVLAGSSDGFLYILSPSTAVRFFPVPPLHDTHT